MPVERHKFFQEKNNIEIVEKKRKKKAICESMHGSGYGLHDR